MKFTNTKKIASSALAILLCASMILSFSLSVYADGSDADYITLSTDSCSAAGCTFLYATNSFVAETYATEDEFNIRYMDVVTTIFGNYCEGDSDGTIWDMEYDDVREYPELTISTVRVVLSYFGDEWLVTDVGSGHSIIDCYGNIASEGTYLEF